MTTRPDPHGVLGVSPDASIDEIRLAYRRRMRALHPDRGGADDVVAHDEMAAVTAAWRRLNNDPGTPFAPGSVEPPVEVHERVDDGPAPRMLRPTLMIAVLLLLAWIAVFVVIAFSQSG